MPTQPHDHLLTLDINGTPLNVPMQIFLGALFQCISQPQQQFVLHYVRQILATQNTPAIVVPGNGTPFGH